jgi:trk system potassium uptake protein
MADRPSRLVAMKAVGWRPEALLVTTFAGLILAGTVALSIPASHASRPIGWVDALFTCTSAVCVTGLAVVDTGTAWTRTGQTIILLLIQIGGLGIMTFAAAAFQLFNQPLSVTSHAALQDTFFQPEARTNLRRAFGRIVASTLIIEALGAGLIYLSLGRQSSEIAGWFEAVFLSVSAFCNAGFATFKSNLIDVRGSYLAIWTIMGLITLGGLGYTVIFECWDRFLSLLRRRQHAPLKWSLNARVVLVVSACLTFGGGLALAGVGLTASEDTWVARLYHGLFQSVTARTAGFNTVDIAALPVTGLMLIILLMFIGGSPGSCAGGIKTTSAAIGVAGAWTGLTGGESVTIFDRRIPTDVLQRTAMVIGMAALWQGAGIFILCFTENVGSGPIAFEHVVFEQVSAFNTVGLSANVSPQLSTAGKLWITLSMFAGRVGPLTMALAVLKRPRSPLTFPVERIMVG